MLVMWTLYFSHCLTNFFIGLRRICLVFITWWYLVGIDCEADKLKVTFSWMKNTPFCRQIYSSSQNAENRILGLWNVIIFWGRTRKGYRTAWKDIVLFVHFAFAYVTGFEDYRTTLKSYDCLWIRMPKVMIDSYYLLSHRYKFCYFWL